jgi:hypothetical protein
MSDRLAELRRQRALVQEHLAWLDREIAAAEKISSAPTSAPALSSAPASESRGIPSAATAAIASVAISDAADSDAILEKYRVPPDTLKSDLRKGCFLYFAAAMLLFALGVVGLYYALRSR